MINKEIIVERSKAYGNNFPMLATLWKNFFKMKYNIQVPMTDDDAAILMCLHKISRLSQAPNDTDTLQDMLNYAWLGINYNQYLSLLQQQNSPRLTITPQVNFDDQDYYCYKDNITCVYHNSQWVGNVTCQEADRYQRCDWTYPIQIN